jgi:hypothetical protein
VTDFLQLISSLREQMSASLLRSDVLRPLVWPLGILMFAIILMIHAAAPNWLLILMAGLFFAIIVLYVLAFVFCLLKDRDALRSEKYSLNKMAIEHRLIGDNVAGSFEPDQITQSSIEDAAKQIEHQP